MFKDNIYFSKLNGGNNFGHSHLEVDSTTFLPEVFSSSHHHAPTFFSLAAEKGFFPALSFKQGEGAQLFRKTQSETLVSWCDECLCFHSCDPEKNLDLNTTNFRKTSFESSSEYHHLGPYLFKTMLLQSALE